jgi:hypothetical protein
VIIVLFLFRLLTNFFYFSECSLILRVKNQIYAVLSAFTIEDYQEFPHDNTALNGIRLICKNTNGTIVDRNVTSKVGPFGKWVGETVCEKINGVQLYLTSFALQVHRIPNQTELEALSLSEVLNVSN